MYSCKLKNFVCASRLRERGRCAARTQTCDDHADSDPINHVTFQIFSNSSFQKCTQQQKKKKKRERRCTLKEKRISTYLTPTTALARPLYTHLALPSAIHRGLMMLQSAGLRLYGERAGDTERVVCLSLCLERQTDINQIQPKDSD